MDGPGNSGEGYRAIWHTLQLCSVQVSRETVRLVVKDLDPDSVRETPAKTLRLAGPNYIWYVDGYDKLTHMVSQYMVVLMGIVGRKSG